MDFTHFFHVALKVEDLPASIDFYSERLGGELLARESAGDRETDVGYAAFRIADKRIYLFEQAPYEAAGLVDPLPTGVLHVGYVVPNVDDAYQTLAAEGVSFFMEPTDFGSLRICFFRDPNGVRIELLEEQ